MGPGLLCQANDELSLKREFLGRSSGGHSCGDNMEIVSGGNTQIQCVVSRAHNLGRASTVVKYFSINRSSSDHSSRASARELGSATA